MGSEEGNSQLSAMFFFLKYLNSFTKQWTSIQFIRDTQMCFDYFSFRMQKKSQQISAAICWTQTSDTSNTTRSGDLYAYIGDLKKT